MIELYETQRAMRNMRKAAMQRGVVAVLDVGSSKIACLVLRFDGTERLSDDGIGPMAGQAGFRVIGAATTRSRGVTFGEIATDPGEHGFSKVPGHLHLCLDLRSAEPEALELAERELRRTAERIVQETGAQIDLGPRSDSAPAPLSPELRACLGDAASAAGIETLTMPSGAGHDAATYARAGVPSAMLFIRNRNGSHNPDEAMEAEDFDAALSVLEAALDDPRLTARHREEAA